MILNVGQTIVMVAIFVGSMVAIIGQSYVKNKKNYTTRKRGD